MNRRLLLAICAGLYACHPIGYADFSSSSSSTAVSQNTANALYKIGVTASDIGQMEISGTPPETLVQTFTSYANSSDDAKYKGLNPPDRDSLVAFAFKLKSKQLISSSSLESLMVAEKLRTGMPKAHIKELMSLTETIKDNPNYILTTESIDIIDYAAPFINDNPFAFADVLGTLLGPVLKENSEPTDINGSPLMVSSSTEQILINAAKTLNGLTQEQMDNLQSIGDNYQASQEFDSSEENVTDVNQVIETSYYPSSANLLLPFLGADTLIAMSAIAYDHPYSFNEETVNEYNRNVTRDPTVENYNRAGTAPRYNSNWANNRANAANTRAQDRGNAADTRAQDRGNAADNRAQNRNGNPGRDGSFDGGGRGDGGFNSGGGNRGGYGGGGGGGRSGGGGGGRGR